jgi:hypothetical protein
MHRSLEHAAEAVREGCPAYSMPRLYTVTRMYAVGIGFTAYSTVLFFGGQPAPSSVRVEPQLCLSPRSRAAGPALSGLMTDAASSC